MSFLSDMRVGAAQDPFRRSRRRATVVRRERARRVAGGAAAAVLLGAVLLNLPGGAVTVKPNAGQAIAVWTRLVQHSAQGTYADLVHQVDRGAALTSQRSQLTAADFDSARGDIRAKIAADEDALNRDTGYLATLNGDAEQWFHLYGGDASSTILGPAKLTAEQMAAYVRSTGVHVRTTVPILTLARMYLEEGAIEGVRGDVAFAQAIKETGDFSSSDVLVNNFAGLGHCSACPHGIPFATARDGVRAQLQLLRWLADPTIHSLADFSSQPATLPATFTHNGHSRPTWASLGGLWAPNPQYGVSIYTLFLRIRAFAPLR
ncbi:MAG TPA: glucosaminidase domain-containing protein [Acidimicrobiia bacterium]|jgi:hypothetical protein